MRDAKPRFSLILTASLVALWSVAASGACGGDPDGEELTTVATTGVGAGGTGGTTTGGEGGTGGDPTTGGGGTTSSTGGNGGTGGMGEETIHGCLSTTAADMTGMANVNVDIPGGDYCIVVDTGTMMTFTLTDDPSIHRPLGGFYDGQVKNQDAQSPIVSCCDASPYVCCPMVTNPPFNLAVAGVYPWYDDKNPDTIKGVVYVE